MHAEHTVRLAALLLLGARRFLLHSVKRLHDFVCTLHQSIDSSVLLNGGRQTALLHQHKSTAVCMDMVHPFIIVVVEQATKQNYFPELGSGKLSEKMAKLSSFGPGRCS
jgi:hypothetical protein